MKQVLHGWVRAIGVVAFVGLFVISPSIATTQTGTSGRVDPKNWPRKRLVRLMRSLADEAFELFVVQDSDRRVYGMAYEFVRNGHRLQGFGLDSMHDGAWLMSALVTAHRVDPEGRYLQRAQRFQVPFYVNLLTHSDQLFPNMIPREGQETFEEPIKGWAPRGWDDGPGRSLATGKPFSAGEPAHPDETVIERDDQGRFQHAYFTSSHHLLQDLADSLMNVWLTTRDPEVARAIRLIHRGRQKHGRTIPVVRTATGLTSGKSELYERSNGTAFDPATALRPIWQGFVEEKTERMGFYSDDLAWQYGEERARAALHGKQMHRGFLSNAIGRMYATSLATEAYFGTERYRHGYTLDAHGLTFNNGQIVGQHEEEQIMFARGIQYAWIGAALLSAFRNATETWEEGMDKLEGSEQLKKLRNGLSSHDLTFRTDPERVVERLDRLVIGTIAYWARIREKIGHLPRGYFTDGRNTSWVRTAELGAYAHLIKLIAYRLMQIDGVTEWERIRTQTPDQPHTHRSLPESVLEKQGLK